jgi:hypothetical protein
MMLEVYYTADQLTSVVTLAVALQELHNTHILFVCAVCYTLLAGLNKSYYAISTDNGTSQTTLPTGIRHSEGVQLMLMNDNGTPASDNYIVTNLTRGEWLLYTIKV